MFCVAQCVCDRACVLAFACAAAGFINLRLNRVLLPVQSQSVIHYAFRKYCHKAASTST